METGFSKWKIHTGYRPGRIGSENEKGVDYSLPANTK